MVTLQQLIDAWNYFFHAPEPFHTIGAFRIAWGAMLLLSGMLMVRDVRRFYGPEGVLSAGRHQQIYGKSRFSLFQLLPETNAAAYFVLGLHLVSCVLVMIGLYTRMSTIVCWTTLLSLHHRNPCVVHGGDTVLRLLTFLMIFSHAGDAYSMDVALASKGAGQSESRFSVEQWNQRNAESPPKTSSLTSPVPTGSPWAVRLMQIQVSIIYLRTVFWKLRGKRWWDGTAAYYPTQVTSFARLRLPAVFVNRFWIALATYGTMIGEVSMGTVVWIDELRYPVLMAGIAMHLVLELFLNLQLFGWTMLASFLLFVKPNDLERWVATCLAWLVV